jgi:hypothetical protein
MKFRSYLAAALVVWISLLAVGSVAAATVIHVPADQPSIQAGINAAQNGDTVLVSPGTYIENIDFNGKAIIVKSSNGPAVTVIDGGGVSSVVTFSSNETSSAVLNGFTLQHGDSSHTATQMGGGVAIEKSSPTIKNNIVQGNFGAYGGGGIGVSFGSPLIQGNIIRNNSQSPNVDSGIGGGGIGVNGAGSTQIIGNVILHNSWSNAGVGLGGGIALFDSGSTLIENNYIVGNVAGTQGPGIDMEQNVSGTVIIQNLIVGNSSPDDAGVYWFYSPAVFANNTIIDGRGTTSTVVALIPNTTVIIANNIIVASNGVTHAFSCRFSDLQNPLKFYNNDIFSSKGVAYFGCTDQTGARGNISTNPAFVGKGNFRLASGSAAIDAGSNTAPHLPKTDFAGNPRIINGNGGPTAIVDMGAYEFVPVTLTPKGLNFGLQSVGSTTTKTVTLTNAQNKSLTISSESAPTGYKLSGCGTTLAAFSSCSLTVTFHPLTTGSFSGKGTVKDNAGNSPQTFTLAGRAQ